MQVFCHKFLIQTTKSSSGTHSFATVIVARCIDIVVRLNVRQLAGDRAQSQQWFGAAEWNGCSDAAGT